MEKQRTNRVQTHSAHKQINEREKKKKESAFTKTKAAKWSERIAQLNNPKTKPNLWKIVWVKDGIFAAS